MNSSSLSDPSFDKYPWIEDIASAWKGHRAFAHWLVHTLRPSTIVELGVDWGYSTFVFGTALQEITPSSPNESKGVVCGIDLFTGDNHAGYRNTYESVLNTIRIRGLSQIHIIKGDFTSVSKTWTKPIDILHIDGLHTYEAVKEDFTNWSPFVKEDGIILFHDVTIQEFGIKDFFHQSKDGFPFKYYFRHSAGLGILTKNKKLMEEIQLAFPDVVEYHSDPIVKKVL